ncbi:MAG: alpha-ketoglutarate-dependent dioxygenase AlkB [Methylococcales bacterium]|nr:alpha-ketoglutarate-dependent dioxygenase AlkB [Methylococcales bacterium]
MKNILKFDGELYLIKSFYREAEAQLLFVELRHGLAWQQEQIFLYGRWLKVPRLMCWYGDKGACYQYSGVNHQPLPWLDPLLTIKQKILSYYPSYFNSVMANLYRNGADSMGCHADDEKELGHNPVIASLSLGEERLLKFRHKQSKEVLDVILSQGDLLIMAGDIQHHWRHELPKTKKQKTERINLTFRKIINFQK